MKIFKYSFVCLVISYGLPAYSAEEGISQQYSSCMDQATSTQDMLECISAEYQIQDTRLNLAYKVLQQNLSSDRKKQLLETQRLWIKYRDANCQFYDDPEGGSIARLSANVCGMMSTATRAQELEDLAVVNGGD